MFGKSFILAVGAIAVPAAAQTLTVSIPRIPVAEYHKPYVAAWLEPAAGGPIRTVALWYQQTKSDKNEPGTKWLSDLRTWWRKGGRSLKLPADGVSGATRAPGAHRIPLPRDLKPGAYVLHVEAARENGGREYIKLPLNVPVRAGSAKGTSELGAVTVTVR